MKKCSLFLFFVVFVSVMNGQTITFTDPVFKNKLLESSTTNFIARNLNGDYFSIDSNSNGEVEIAEALQVGFLQIENSSINSLNEINNFSNLITLNCENNLLTSLNISSLSFLTILNCSNNQLINLNVSSLTELQNLNCQFNQLTTLNVGGITNLSNLNCSYNQISLLNLTDLLNLEVFVCNDNVLTTFDFSDLISVKSLDCSNNLITTINTSSLISLETLFCNSNLLSALTINSLLNLNTLNCSNNQINALNLINLPNLIDLNCNFNQLTSMNLNGLISLSFITCTNNQLNYLNLTGVTQLEDLNCSNNIILALDLSGLINLNSLNCSNNQLTNLDISNLTNLKYLYCNANAIVLLNVDGLQELLVISCTNNQIAALNLNTTTKLQSLYCSNNFISTLNLSNQTSFQNLFCGTNSLTSLFIKNGAFESNLQFSGNPNLQYICADNSEIEFVQEEINNNSYTNCHVNSYCSFVPGGITHNIQGTVKLDSNTNGCDTLDGAYPNLQLSFSDDTISESSILSASGNFSKVLSSGSYTITPILENTNFFSVSPTSFIVDLPQLISPVVQNFCVSPMGNHSDTEIIIVPLNNAMPGLEAKYKIIYKNKGTITQSGTINFNFNDNALDFLVAIPTITSQSSNNLNWAFTNLSPLESRIIYINFSVSASSVSYVQVLPFTATVITSIADETPLDNVINFNQEVVNTTLTLEKGCIEGATVSTSYIGEYVHYYIRFKNDGTAIAQNVVVKDIIDTTKYNFSTLFPIDGSHVFETRLTNSNTVEFIFENINLDFGATNNDGYVMFKIKTLPTLSIGDTFSNAATVYFDYKAPLSTNMESTTITALSNQTFDFSKNYIVSPNPVAETLNVYSNISYTVNSLSIYNSLGQLIQIISNPSSLSVDVSRLKSGVYFINLNSEKGTTSIKFIKK
ncbi:DUF7619 domain-containing protein [Flavobacterium aquatile]|uniref:DUF7619 domain-containing protein n=1 Tax=Flavobacterium aquatile TaxID=245 RepID=UPI0005529E3F|nr:T9SS type A sorting domain-containing protein [Flavobacterium aquatile]